MTRISWLLALGILLGVSGAAAQGITEGRGFPAASGVPGPPVQMDAIPPDPQVQQRDFVVQPDPGGTLVAVTLHFSSGASVDPQGREGTTHLLGRWMEYEAGRRVSGLESGVFVEVTQDDLTLTLLAPPSSWEVALDRVEALWGTPPSGTGSVDRIREDHRSRLIFEGGAPVRTFELERARLLAGASPDEARPIRGTPESVARITADDLDVHLRSHLELSGALTVVVGPVRPEAIRTRARTEPRVISGISPFTEAPTFGDGLRGDPAGQPVADTTALAQIPQALRTRLFRSAPSAPAPVFRGTRAWESGQRINRDMELTAAWMAVAWALPDDVSQTLLDFLAHTLRETVVPSPPDPGLYGAEVQVVYVEGRPVVVVSVTADPRAAHRWHERVVGSMESLAQAPPQGSFFELTRRRFRNRALLTMAGPGERSRVLARDLRGPGEVEDFGRTIWRFTPDELAAAAGAASDPRILIMGPLEMIDRGAGR